MKKYYVLNGSAPGVKEFSDHDDMIEHVRKCNAEYGRLPTVVFGELLEFEPAEIVKSWKIKTGG